MNYLKREVFIKSINSDDMWRRNLTKDEILNFLNLYELTLDAYEYEKDLDFIMDSRRFECVDKIKNFAKKDSPSNLLDMNRNDMMWSFWEFISEEYCGNSYKKNDEVFNVNTDILDCWNRYKAKGIISLQEKDQILDMINTIKNYCL